MGSALPEENDTTIVDGAIAPPHHPPGKATLGNMDVPIASAPEEGPGLDVGHTLDIDDDDDGEAGLGGLLDLPEGLGPSDDFLDAAAFKGRGGAGGYRTAEEEEAGAWAAEVASALAAQGQVAWHEVEACCLMDPVTGKKVWRR